jgi:Phage Terminase
MPWQRHVADVALEVDPATRRLVYREVRLTVPRQSGKTTLILALAVQRALGFGSAQNITYAAQTRLDARKKWEDDQVPTLEASRDLSKLFRVRKTTGNEAVLWRNGSRYGIVSATIKAGHGPTIDQAFIDEAFAQVDSRLEQAFKPSMITRPQPQLWVVSTAGTELSIYLRGKVDSGRALAEAGQTDLVSYFEWSALDDADPADPVTWWACMPALGHTVTEDAVRADFASMPLPEFRRAYLNQWPDVAGEVWKVIPQATWDALADNDSELEDPVAFAVAVHPEARSACIAVAGRRSDGNVFVEVLPVARGNDLVTVGMGTAWVKDRLLELDREFDPCAIVVDVGSPAGSIAEELTQAGLRIVAPRAREVAQSCAQFYDAATDSRTLRHLGDVASQKPLRLALAAAQKYPLGDSWRWDRRLPVDQSPLEAVTLAAWGYRTYGMELGPGDVTVAVV